MQLGTITANIIVDGKALDEYDVDIESPTQATCWVPSEDGKPFTIQWEYHEASRSKGIKGSVWVDGIECGAKPDSSGINKVVFSQFVRGTIRRDLMFARVQLSDDDSLLSKEVPKNLGEISLVICRGTIVKERYIARNRDLSMLEDRKLHERSKKATVHCVGFGPEMTRRTPSHRSRLIRNNDPELTFVFKYRPLGVLQANGIAPRQNPRGPSSSRESPSQHELTPVDRAAPEDIKPAELNDRIQSLENELKRLKDLQHDSSEDRKPKRVKREERSRPLFSPGEIIDLT